MLSPLTDRVYAVVRIVVGLMFSFHGMQKLFGLLSDHPKPAVGSQVWVGGVIELAAGLLIAAGFFSRCAAFVASGTMAVAYWQFHVGGSKLEGISKFLPGTNGGELAVVYCFLFLFIACKGSGPMSLDAMREKKSNSK
ncbi:MAG: DoxX family protein [Planctomycetes bacterium]|nr:DoxX family protein [Planctomycetota bacterium]